MGGWMLQKFLTVNVPVNISMLNELADRIAIALGYSFPTYLASRSVRKSAFSTQRMSCQQTLYIDAVAHRLASNDYCVSPDLLLVTDILEVKKNILNLVL
jgi:3-methyladenine DNA glycosylase/8-oxoguanine DNA glycosylase